MPGLDAALDVVADAEPLRRALAGAKRAHDAAPCAADGTATACALCAARRARGAQCALPGCGVRQQRGGGGDSGDAAAVALQHCSRCFAAAYCGVAHQRAAWPLHKKDCVARRDAAAGAAGTSA
jgi:hypothetical protein